VLHAKTGSLASVSALAGFVEDDDPALTFALVVNAAPSAAIEALEGKVASALARWPDIPDVAKVGPKVDHG
jgi:D-alanyl-D-alanine carboxypeptidase